MHAYVAIQISLVEVGKAGTWILSHAYLTRQFWAWFFRFFTNQRGWSIVRVIVIVSKMHV